MHANLAWDDFRLVKAIADHNGLTGAAAALGVNHSTVFRRLGQIEECVGQQLFERRKTGYVATAAGVEMAALAARMDEDVTAFSRRLAGRDVAPSGELRITTTDTLHQNVLLPIFADFRRAHPLIRLDIVMGNQALNLSKRDADIAIRASDTPGETLVGRRIADIAWAIYGRTDDGVSAEEIIDPTLLYKRDWVALGDQLSHVKAARFVREHVAPERIALKSSAVLGIAEAVEHGLGIGPVPCFIADQRPKLTRLSPPNADFATGLWVLTHPDIRHVPRVRAFMDFCSGELARQRALFEG